jgi:hypothetical protein
VANSYHENNSFFGKFSFSKLRFSFLQKLQRVSIGSKLFWGVVWEKEHSLSDTQRGEISDDRGQEWVSRRVLEQNFVIYYLIRALL